MASQDAGDILPLITADEAATRLGLSSEEVVGLCTSGALRSYRLPGKHLRVSAAEVDRLAAIARANPRALRPRVELEFTDLAVNRIPRPASQDRPSRTANAKRAPGLNAYWLDETEDALAAARSDVVVSGDAALLNHRGQLVRAPAAAIDHA